MKNNKLKNLHAKLEVEKLDSGLKVLQSELDEVRGGATNRGCQEAPGPSPINYFCWLW